MSEAKKTTDHEQIRQWAESRDGYPASVEGTSSKDEEAGLLRIGFRDQESLDEISWDAFFDKFEEENLAFLYQDQVEGGKPSRFFKLVRRDTKSRH